MERVVFITTETGTDLIVSFALHRPGNPEDIESLTLLRTPPYEAFLPEHERGIRVFSDRTAEGERELLTALSYRDADGIVELTTAAGTYTLDVRRVEPDDLAAMRRVLRRMNNDRRVSMSGV
jgi:hypothetical protein